MRVCGIILIRLYLFTIILGFFSVALMARAQETDPTYRAFYHHQIAEAIMNEEITSGAVKNGFITYHKEGGGVVKLLLPQWIQSSDDFRIWFMDQAEKAKAGDSKAQMLINNIISDHLSGGYKTHAGGQPLLGFSTAPKEAAMHISMFGLGSSFSGHAPCAIIEIMPEGGGLCRPKDFLSPQELKKIAEGIVSRNPALDSKSIIQGMNAEAIMLGIKRDEIQSFIFRQSTPDGKVVTRTIQASDIFKIFDEYKGLLSQNEIQGIFDVVFHKSALTYNSKSSYNPSFDPLNELEKRITATVEVKTRPAANETLPLFTAPIPDEASLMRLEETKKIYLALQKSPAQGVSPANRNPLLERKINYPLKQLFAQANKGIDVSAQSKELLSIARSLQTDPENVKRLALPQSPINERLKNIMIVSTETPASRINRAGFIALGGPSQPAVRGMQISRPPRTIETSLPDAIANGNTQKSKLSVTRLDAVPFKPQAWEKANALVIESSNKFSIAAQAEAARKASTNSRSAAIKMIGIKNIFQKIMGFLIISSTSIDLVRNGFLTYDEITMRIDLFESILENPENINAMYRQIEQGNYNLSKQYKALSDELRDLKKDKAAMDREDKEALKEMTPEQINDLYLRQGGVI